MFLRQLSSTVLLHSRPGLRSSTSSSSFLPRLTPAPPPWWSIRESPSFPPHLPLLRQVFLGRRSSYPAQFSLFSTSACLMMERSDKEPPHKRRRSVEEKPHRGAGGGGSRKEQRHRDTSADPRPNHHHGDRGGGEGKGGARRGFGWKHRDGDGGTKAGGKDGRRPDGSRQQENTNQRRSCAQQQGLKASQPAGARTQTPNPHPVGTRTQTPNPHPVGARTQTPNPHPAGTRTQTPNPHPAGTRTQTPNPHPVGTRTQTPNPHPVGTRTQTPNPHPAGARTQTPNPHPGPPHRPNPWGTEQQGGWPGRNQGPQGAWPGQGQGAWPGQGQGAWPGQGSGQGAGLHPSQLWQLAPPPPPGTRPPVPQQQVNVKCLQRRWESSPACRPDVQPPGDDRTFDFSVASYNILSQQLLQENSRLYQHCHPRVLPWSHRLPNLLAEIQQLNADILCLQEVQEDHYESQIKPALQALGYQCVFKKRTGRKPDGCATIFKTSRLSLLSSNPVEFLRPGDALLDRDNVGLVLLLRPNDAAGQSDPSSFVCVANTHLLYNTRRGDIKLAQLAILLAEIGRLSRLPGGSANPVVLCGDFNSTPRSPLYRFLTTGCLDYRGLHSSMVSGQEEFPRGGRVLSFPLWSHSLGINQQCQYESSAESAAVEGGISNLSVQDQTSKDQTRENQTRENPTRENQTRENPTRENQTRENQTRENQTSKNQTREAAAAKRKRIEHGLKLQSSYVHHLQPDGRAEVTTCHSHTAMTVDYILFTPPGPISRPSLPGGRGLQLLGRLSLVGLSELQEVNGLPNQHHSSDHLPLLARFRLHR